MCFQKYWNKLYLADRWTIGFIDCSVEKIITDSQSRPEIHWVEHKYKDRFFADPFILDVKPDGTKIILVEEMIWLKAKGTIVELTISPENRIVGRKEILVEKVHLSYPFIVRKEDGVYIYPESCRAGVLAEYKYTDDGLLYVKDIIDFPVCDATFTDSDGAGYWFCTHKGETQDSELHIYKADSVGRYKELLCGSVKFDASTSRPAGSFVKASDGTLYRPAQDCSVSYGGGISFMRIDELNEDRFRETFVFGIYPDADGECPNGLHTINSYKGVTVVDGIRRRKFAPFIKIIFVLRNILGV